MADLYFVSPKIEEFRGMNIKNLSGSRITNEAFKAFRKNPGMTQNISQSALGGFELTTFRLGGENVISTIQEEEWIRKIYDSLSRFGIQIVQKELKFEEFNLEYLSLGKKDIVFFDLETTGRDPEEGHEIIEIYALKTDYRGNKISDFYSLVKPERRMSYGAFKAHGKNNPDLNGAPEQSEVLRSFREFIGDSVLCGYNICKFDIPFLNYSMKKLEIPILKWNHTIDMFEIVKEQLQKESYGIPSQRLSDVAKYLGVETGESHKAKDDVKAVKEIFTKIYSERKDRIRGYIRMVPPYEELKQLELMTPSSKAADDLKKNNLEILGIEEENGFLKHEFLKPLKIESRPEQIYAAAKGIKEGTLIGDETSLGKIFITILMIINLLKQKKGKAIILVPALSIIDDHKRTFENVTQGIKAGILTGKTHGKHQEIIKGSDVLIGTPETVYKLIKEIDWSQIALCVLDEADLIHEKYYGKEIVKSFRKKKGKDALISLLTATIGEKPSDVEKLLLDFGLSSISSRIIIRDKEEVGHPYRTYREKIVIPSLRTEGFQMLLQELIVREMDIIRREGALLSGDEEVDQCLRGIEERKSWEDAEKHLFDFYNRKYKNRNAAIKKAEKTIMAAKELPRGYQLNLIKWNLYVSILEKYIKGDFRNNAKKEDNFEALKASALLGGLYPILRDISGDHLYEAYHAFLKFSQKDTKGVQELKEDQYAGSIFNFIMTAFELLQKKDKERWNKEIIEGGRKKYELDFPPIEELLLDPRLEEIKNFCKNFILPNEKALILAPYRLTVSKIAESLRAEGIPCYEIWGGQKGEVAAISDKERNERIDAFLEGKIKALAATSLRRGVNLKADWLIIETIFPNPREFEHSLGRVGRTKDGYAMYFVGTNESERAKWWELRKRSKLMKETREAYK